MTERRGVVTCADVHVADVASDSSQGHTITVLLVQDQRSLEVLRGSGIIVQQPKDHAELVVRLRIVRIEVHRTLSKAAVAHAFGGALALAQVAEPRGTVDVDVNVFTPLRLTKLLDPHLRDGDRALVAAGVCKDEKDAFGKYLALGKPAYVKMDWPGLEEAIGWIREAGGVAVDGAGRVYVAEYTSGRVQVFDSAGAFVTQWMADRRMPLLDLAAGAPRQGRRADSRERRADSTASRARPSDSAAPCSRSRCA